MRPIGLKRLGLAGAAAVVLFVAPSARGGSGANGGSGGSTVTIDLGTIGYGLNVNASIINAGASNQLETYTYQQLLFGGNNLNMMLDSGLTVEQVLEQDIGLLNPGTLNYNFPFSLGASGSYQQNGPPPPFPPVSELPGNVSLTATSVSGHICPGFNDIGATISVDPTNAGNTFATILGCDSFSNLSNGFPTSITTTVSYQLGTVTSNSGGNVTVDVIQAEDSTTTWTSTGQANPGTATPEPSSASLAVVGLVAALCAVRIRKRCRA